MKKKIGKKTVIQAAKIAVGSSIAILVAEALGLQFATSAGTIALLTVVTTKWETVKLSLARIVTFAMAVLLALVIFTGIGVRWEMYGLYMFSIVLISQCFGWGATVSVNSVIGAHFLSTKDFSPEFILNEFLLVLIGITIAFVLNLFHLYSHSERTIIQCMRDTEKRLQMILRELAEYLYKQEMKRDVWDDIRSLEHDLKDYIVEACEYQDNTFQSHPAYYIDYFEMRMQQLGVLHSLHYEMRKIRNMPTQAHIIADYIAYLVEYVVETNSPTEQIEHLLAIFEKMKDEPLPETHEEFEARAILYHILMDLEDFLIYKRRFVDALDEVQKELYWEKE